MESAIRHAIAPRPKKSFTCFEAVLCRSCDASHSACPSFCEDFLPVASLFRREHDSWPLLCQNLSVSSATKRSPCYRAQLFTGHGTGACSFTRGRHVQTSNSKPEGSSVSAALSAFRSEDDKRRDHSLQENGRAALPFPRRKTRIGSGVCDGNKPCSVEVAASWWLPPLTDDC